MTVPAPRSPGAVKCLSSGPSLCQRLDFAACQAPAAPPLCASAVLQTHKEVCEWSEGSGEGGNILGPEGRHWCIRAWEEHIFQSRE